MFYAPESLSAEVVQMVLELISVDVKLGIVERWTPHELLVAYDYAMRAHLRASDNPTHLRPQPWFVTTAAAMSKAAPFHDPTEAFHSGSRTAESDTGRITVNDHIRVTTPGVSAEYRINGVRIVYDTEHLTFMSDELDKAGITEIEMANYAGMCSRDQRVTARGRKDDKAPWLFLHASGTVCTHDFRPAESHMFGEWEPS
jgi:hypothetical protein